MKKIYFLAIISLVQLMPAWTQSPIKQYFSVPPAGSSNTSFKDESPWYTSVSHHEAGQQLGQADQILMGQLKAQTSLLFPHKSGNNQFVERSVPDPIINRSWIANQSSGSAPLDNYVATSEGNYVTSVSNTLYQVYDEDGTLLQTKSLGGF